MKLARVFSGSEGITTIPLEAIKVSGSIGNKADI
tara:strand:+ start:402 stop:503 length:102 start_codon:yes stop_codon:yes gene_type:complete